MRDRLIDLIVSADISLFGTDKPYAEVYADHILADGWIRLPCKVGDTVYTNIIGTGLHNSFRVNKVDLLGFGNGLYSWTWHQLGKSVFLSLEEAEQALKGGVQE